MKSYRFWIAVTILASIVAFAAHLHFVVLARFPLSLSGPLSPWRVFADALPVAKTLMSVAILMTLAAVFIAWRAMRMVDGNPERDTRMTLHYMALAIVGAGALAAGYGELNTQIAVAATGVTRPDILAPSRAEAMLALAVGTWGATIALCAAAALSRASTRR